MSLLDIARQHLADCIADVEEKRDTITGVEDDLRNLRLDLAEAEQAEAEARAAIALLTGGAA